MTFNTTFAYDKLLPYFEGRVRHDEPLSHHCAFGVGGTADIWVSVESKRELLALVSMCAEEHWPLLIVGNGTNIVYADAGVRGIVARVNMRNYTIEDNGAGSALLLAEAGVSWPLLLHEVALLGWGGLEFGVGIPGTLGGAVISNAGAHNNELGNVLEWIEILDARGSSAAAEDEISYPIVRRLQHDQLDLSYRYSRFRERRQFRFDDQGGIILPARGMIEPAEIVMLLGIRLHREDSGQLQARIAEYKMHRKMTEPPAYRAGTIFKDPAGLDVDSLLAQVGMKGRTYGKAQISTSNANYIMNLGEARAMDIAALIVEAHRRILDRFGIDLELDVELRGAWGSGDEAASDQETSPVIGQVTKVYPYVHPLLEMDEEQNFSQD